MEPGKHPLKQYYLFLESGRELAVVHLAGSRDVGLVGGGRAALAACPRTQLLKGKQR